jgi:hypothetical protein
LRVVYERQDLMSSQYMTSIVSDEVLYGVDGRADVGAASLRALRPLTGEVLWTRPDFGMATLILADQTLLAMKADGELVLFAADPRAYRELSRFRLCAGTTRALPALAAGRLYVRDERTLRCFDLNGG